MIKSIFKEAIIIILLIIVIVLILGIILYEYSPISRKTPNKIEAYTLSNEMQEELNETIEVSKTQNIIKTYKVDAQDLKLYEDKEEYKKGKVNPFAKTNKTNTNNTNNTDNTSNSAGTNSTTNDVIDNNNTNNSQGQFLNTVGK